MLTFQVHPFIGRKSKDTEQGAFKLLEIQEKFHLLKQGQVVVDLGAAPGVLQVIAEWLERRAALGFDLQEMRHLRMGMCKPKWWTFWIKKVFEALRRHGLKKVDGVTSDLARNQQCSDLDQGRSAS